MPSSVVTRKIPFRPSAIVMFWRILARVARQTDHLRQPGQAVMRQRGVRGFQRHVGAASHRNANG
jgi:hypothetical protein